MNIKEIVEQRKDDIISTTQEIIKIKVLKINQKKVCLLEKVLIEHWNMALNLSKQMGFKTKNLDGYAGYAEFGRR